MSNSQVSLYLSSRGGLEVERLLHKLHDSTSVGLNPDWGQKDFRNNSNNMGGALINNGIAWSNT